jgi:hypothetical protein
MLAAEWVAHRRRSLYALPLAAALLAALAAVVLATGLHRSDSGFLAGILVGAFAYWAVLEAVTVVRVGRLLREAARRRDAAGTAGPR